MAISGLSSSFLNDIGSNVPAALSVGLLPLLNSSSLVGVSLASQLKVLIQAKVSEFPPVVCNFSFAVRRGEFLGVSSSALPNTTIVAREPDKSRNEAEQLQDQIKLAEYSAAATTVAVAVSVAVAVANSGDMSMHGRGSGCT